jgi:hypothetical protein
VVRWRQRNVRAAGTQSLQPVLRVWEIQKELNRQSPWPLNIQEQSLVTALDGDHDQVAAIENVLRLLAETKAIAIIIGNSPLSDFGLASTNGYWVRC